MVRRLLIIAFLIGLGCQVVFAAFTEESESPAVEKSVNDKGVTDVLQQEGEDEVVGALPSQAESKQSARSADSGGANN